MKKLTLCSIFMAALSVCFSQTEKEDRSRNIIENSESIQSTDAKLNQVKKASDVSKPVTISKRAGEEQKIHNAEYYQEEITKIDNHILAINQKIAHVNSVPSEKALAETNGWFSNMESMKTKLNVKKGKLQERLELLILEQ